MKKQYEIKNCVTRNIKNTLEAKTVVTPEECLAYVKYQYELKEGECFVYCTFDPMGVLLRVRYSVYEILIMSRV